MEHRDDLFLQMLAGLSAEERADVLTSIDRATDVKRRQIQAASHAEEQRLHQRHLRRMRAAADRPAP